MKPRSLILIPLIICAYGFLPLSFRFNNNALKDPNTLIIHHQQCGCPCPNAFIQQGLLVIPDSIQKVYGNIHKSEVNITGNDPFEPYEPGLEMKEVMIKGKVIGVDTILCDPSGCEVVPVFKVEKWSVNEYYPRFWRFEKGFFIAFLFSVLVSAIAVLWLAVKKITSLLKPR
jgi:hypothetical protein